MSICTREQRAEQELSEYCTCSKLREQEQSQKPRADTGKSKELTVLPEALIVSRAYHG